jgi:hypothetical protein
MKTKIPLIVALVFAVRIGVSQGFVNLNFEAAKNLGVPGSFTQLSATNAFPGWTVSAYYILYDDVSLSGYDVSIIDTNTPYYTTPIQGKYYAMLIPVNLPGYGYYTSIGQTGQIPLSAESISFWGNIGSIQITFNGQPLSFVITDTTPNYFIYGADISAYAGQTGQLLFSVPPQSSGGILDNIQFSSTPVPEPGTFGLFAMGGALLAWRRLKL